MILEFRHHDRRAPSVHRPQRRLMAEQAQPAFHLGRRELNGIELDFILPIRVRRDLNFLATVFRGI